MRGKEEKVWLKLQVWMRKENDRAAESNFERGLMR